MKNANTDIWLLGHQIDSFQEVLKLEEIFQKN